MNKNVTEFNEAKIFTGEPQASVDLLGEGKALVKTQTDYHCAIAVQKPRILDKVVEAVKREAVYGGDDFFYRWPAKTKDGKVKIIEGGTIGLALAIAREWTNCVIPINVEENNGHWIFTASFVDLEKGFTITRSFRQQIPLTAPGKYELARWQDMAFQKGQSQAIRNVIFNGVPRWLRTEAISIAKESSLKKITKEGIDTARTKAVEFLAQYGITEEQIKATIGKELNELLPDDIQTLRNLAVQIQNGDISPETAFPPISSSVPKEEESTGQGSKKEESKQDDKESGKKSNSKPESALTEYYEKMKGFKDRLGDEKYYELLSGYGMKSAADAKTKKVRDSILQTLDTATTAIEGKEMPDETINMEMAPGECPNNGDIMTMDYCDNTCLSRKGCPVWET